MSGLVIMTACCALACGVLVLAEHRKWKAVRIAAKSIASASFIVVGLLAANHCNGSGLATFPTIILIGLVLGAVGDVALLGKSDAAFLAGLGAFLLGHIAYVVAMAGLVAPVDWPSAAGAFAAVPAVIGIAVLVFLWPRLGSMTLPVIAYVIVIVAMVIAAVAALRANAQPSPNGELLALGAVLFFASDLAVARDKFVASTFSNRAWGLPCYYASQLLIAWSLRSTGG